MRSERDGTGEAMPPRLHQVQNVQDALDALIAAPGSDDALEGFIRACALVLAPSGIPSDEAADLAAAAFSGMPECDKKSAPLFLRNLHRMVAANSAEQAGRVTFPDDCRPRPEPSDGPSLLRSVQRADASVVTSYMRARDGFRVRRTPALRPVFEGYWLQGRSAKQIASRLDIPVSVVRDRIFRLRQHAEAWAARTMWR